jgi:D-sedoheptulose 7-phosphate isomerase
MSDPFSDLLYPMLSAQPQADATVLTELAAAPLEKMAESNRLRAEMLHRDAGDILAIADAIAHAGRVFTCGNGGSATTARDLAVRLQQRGVPALCLTDDVAVVTAVANDVSFADVFTRQLIALGAPGDLCVAISTSGNSENLVRALTEAKRHGMSTVALSGYDGGRMVAEADPDHCVVVQSSSVHRIQEVQTTLCHLLVEILTREDT